MTNETAETGLQHPLMPGWEPEMFWRVSVKSCREEQTGEFLAHTASSPSEVGDDVYYPRCIPSRKRAHVTQKPAIHESLEKRFGLERWEAGTSKGNGAGIGEEMAADGGLEGELLIMGMNLFSWGHQSPLFWPVCTVTALTG
ncbi:hypothetical protein NHX12_021885 [Muraenolepis orangiensis]|uniref:Uncharacterized protein n=1 Tax=Muraenolepis orangiensis TaxID=630683 RepID=A0A9Q0EQT4_9TELE|nr:hypothetical protein NHX12_021885 [Muraenolepis orangiensis]